MLKVLTSDFAGRGGNLSKLMDLIEAVTEMLHTHPAEGEKDNQTERALPKCDCVVTGIWRRNEAKHLL